MELNNVALWISPEWLEAIDDQRTSVGDQAASRDTRRADPELAAVTELPDGRSPPAARSGNSGERGLRFGFQSIEYFSGAPDLEDVARRGAVEEVEGREPLASSTTPLEEILTGG